MRESVDAPTVQRLDRAAKLAISWQASPTLWEL